MVVHQTGQVIRLARMQPTPTHPNELGSWLGQGGALSAVERGAMAVLAGRRAPKFDTQGCSLGFPRRWLPPLELRALLLDYGTKSYVKNMVWRRLVELAQEDQEVWSLICAWLALPGLVRKSRQLNRALAGVRGVSSEDIDSELLTGFLLALRGADPRAGTNVCPRLLEAAARHARRELDVDALGLRVRPWGADLDLPTPPVEHPEMVLVRAVRQGVISVRDGNLIAETRLGARSLGGEAMRSSTNVNALWSRRRRAELALVRALQEDLL